jgi:hypothetical protein
MSAFKDIYAENPTPMMEVWAKDAEEFGIPFQTQKGLIFLLAINLRVTVPVAHAYPDF